MIKREGLSVAPELLAVKRAVWDFRAGLARMPNESWVRTELAKLNERIADAILTNTSPLASDVAELDLEEVLAAWRRERRT